jgi:hypothetical protein
MNKVVTVNENLGLNLNTQKTKYMVIDKEQSPKNVLRFNNTLLEKVHKITYIGELIINNWDHFHKMKYHIEKAKAASVKIKNVFFSHQLSTNL